MPSKADITRVCRLASSLLDDGSFNCRCVDIIEGKSHRAFLLIIEKTPGVALDGIWEGLSTLQRYSIIIEKVVAMEKELACLEFPAYGALYLRGSEPANLGYHPVSDALDSADSFCVGPLCNARSKQGGVESSRDSGTSGPWSSLAEFASASTQLKTRTKQTYQKDDGELQSTMHEDPDLPDTEGQDLLESMSIILPILCSDHRILKVSKPTLWHPGLSLDNVLVSATDPTRILGIIGWRSAAILPLFLQAQFPRFLATPTSYNLGDPLLSLAGFASWSPEQK